MFCWRENLFHKLRLWNDFSEPADGADDNSLSSPEWSSLRSLMKWPFAIQKQRNYQHFKRLDNEPSHPFWFSSIHHSRWCFVTRPLTYTLFMRDILRLLGYWVYTTQHDMQFQTFRTLHHKCALHPIGLASWGPNSLAHAHVALPGTPVDGACSWIRSCPFCILFWRLDLECYITELSEC